MYRNLLEQLADGVANEDMDFLVKFECRARTENDAKRCGDALLAYVVPLVLLNCRHAANGVVYILVYGAFATPWRAIYDWRAVVGNAYHRVVVIDECAALNEFHPFVTVGALSLSACAKEHISLAAVFHCCRVHQQCLVWGCAHGENHHQCIVEPKDNVAVAASCGNCEATVLGIALHESAWRAKFVHRENLVCAVVLAIDLECRAGAGEPANLVASPRWLDAVVRCYFKKQIIGAFCFKWDKIRQQ